MGENKEGSMIILKAYAIYFLVVFFGGALWLLLRRPKTKDLKCTCDFSSMEHPDDHRRECPLYERYESWKEGD